MGFTSSIAGPRRVSSYRWTTRVASTPELEGTQRQDAKTPREDESGVRKEGEQEDAMMATDQGRESRGGSRGDKRSRAARTRKDAGGRNVGPRNA